MNITLLELIPRCCIAQLVEAIFVNTGPTHKIVAPIDMNPSKELKYRAKLLTDNICARIKLVLWTSLGRDEPGEGGTLFTVLVLNKTSDLSVVRLPVVLVDHLDHVSRLEVHSLKGADTQTAPEYCVHMAADEMTMICDRRGLTSPKVMNATRCLQRKHDKRTL